ncbi:MAG TPA: xanthine dehydrogenase family protein molybdopterin-binding subunit [Burkholderiales bacterium]|nr:xanthine dehydrogenase family protein molybdopterin-binding subunit [Burkholderiales bacterium]
MQRHKFRHIGAPLARKEDLRFLTGHGRYVEDIEIPGALHACFVRSPHPHARIKSIKTEEAKKLKGVVAIYTGKDLAQWTAPLRMAPPIEGLLPVEMTTLPIDKVRFHGDPVACVIAQSRYLAEDAAERVEVDYEPLPAVANLAQALSENSPKVDESLPSNVVSVQRFSTGDVEKQKREGFKVVECEFHQSRLTHLPIETRGLVAVWDEGRQHLTVHIGNQVPHPFRSQVAARMRLSESQVTIVSPDVGGGFGQKIALYREELAVCAASRELKRPVRWREDRMENLMAASHAREDSCRTRAAVTKEGKLLGLELEILEDFGAYCFYPANYLARVVAMILTGPYKVRDYAFEVKVALTNKCGNGPMRAPMAITSWLAEGTMDAIARELKLDPLEVRRANMVETRELPYTMPTGEVIADITPRETLEAAVKAMDYKGFRERQAKAREEGRYPGIGFCSVVESTTYGSKFYKSAGIPGSGHEAAWLRIEPSGAVNASVGLGATGQGYETAFAQVVADGLGVDPSQVRIQMGNTDVAPYGMGSRGARGGTAGGTAIFLAARDANEKVLAIAAKMLGFDSAEGLHLVDGRVEREILGERVKTDITLAQIARTAYLDPTALPAGMAPGLDFSRTYDPPPMTYSNACHACEVEVDVETGALEITRYVVAEDCGQVLNPIVVEGQQHGAIAMGLSGALLEHMRYDEDGNNITGSLADYLVATSTDLPNFEVIPMHTPSRGNPVGTKGMAEGGVMGAVGVIMSAVNDALAPFGVVADRQPLSPDYLRSLLRGR